jgi:WD40 repeat protein
VDAIAWSPDSRHLASASFDGKIRLWEVSSGECQKVFEGHRGSVNSIAWSPDGRRLVSGGDDGTIRVWEVATGECWYIELFEGDEYAVWNQDQSLRFASDMAWQYLGWQVVVDGRMERLPVETFGRLERLPAEDTDGLAHPPADDTDGLAHPPQILSSSKK